MSSSEFPSLRSILAVDAVTCGAMGLLLLAAAGPLAGLTGLPSPLLFYAGLALLPIALFFGGIASRPVPPAELVRIVIAGNALWVAASLLLVFGPWIEPNAFGHAFIVGQALVVTLLTWLEQRALAGSRREAAGAPV